MDSQAEIAAALRRLSESWRNRRYAELRDCFHDSVVMALPGLSGRIVGRDALVKSYQDFMDKSTLDGYVESPPSIDAFETTAIAYYRWEMVWTSGGRQERGSGHDVFVFERQEDSGRWKAIWRTMLLDEST